MTINPECQGFNTSIQVDHPLLGSGIQVILNNVTEQLEVLCLKGSIRIIIEHVYFSLTNLNGSHVITNKNVYGLSKFHQRINGLEQGQQTWQTKQSSDITKKVQVVPCGLFISCLLTSNLWLTYCHVFTHFYNESFVFSQYTPQWL
jgi:hypothetical protein